MIISVFNLIYRLIAVIDLVLLTAIMYLLSFIPNKVIGKFYLKIFPYWCDVFIRALGVSLYCHEKHHKPLPKQYIAISNHPSALEDVGMPSLFAARYLAKIEVKDWWIVGRISTAAGSLYVHRECKDSRKDAAEDLLEVLKNGDSIGLYPEGGCKGRRIHTPFRWGAFDIAIQSGVPILPVFLHHEAQQQFEWQHQHLLHKLWMIMTAKNRRVNYYVYDAIDPKQFKTKQEFCEHVQNLYLEWQKRYLD
jgi:1-acyl-sn-glycerol-3-phosphate acyltransferase